MSVPIRNNAQRVPDGLAEGFVQGVIAVLEHQDLEVTRQSLYDILSATGWKQENIDYWLEWYGYGE